MATRKTIHAYQSSEGLTGSDLVKHFMPLVHRLARQLSERTGPPVECSDLLQSGLIALLEHQGEAVIDEKRATALAQAAMIEDVRRQHAQVPKLAERRGLMLKAAERLERQTGRDPNNSEIAKELGLGVELIEQIWEQSARELFDAPEAPEILDRELLLLRLRSAVAALNEQEQLVLSLYHEEGLVYEEIGLSLELSAARICQIHGRALVRLRQKLRINQE